MDLLKSTSSGLIWRGVVGIILGLLCAIWPGATILVIAILWGLFAIVTGIWSIGAGIADSMSGWNRFLLIIVGALGVIAGIIVLTQPIYGAVTLTWVLGIWLIAMGVVDIIGAFGADRTAPRWLIILGGVLGIILGYLFVSHPASGTVTLALWLGIVLIAWGIMLIVAGYQLRKAGQGAATA
ncbi:MAG: HdeD family acid-resistance protein [Nostocoides sp.]